MSVRTSYSGDPTQGGAERGRASADLKGYDVEASALELLWRTLFSADGRTTLCKSCGEVRVFHRVAKRRAYACDRCGKQIFPAAVTPFASSAIPLSQWLTTLSMILESPRQVTARHIADRLGISYRTAWGMRKRIERSLAAEGKEARLLRRLGTSYWSEGSHATAEREIEADSPEERICAAACRVMAERGLSETRIADIASEAGLSSASIHYYFRSKDEVLLAAFRWACDQSNKTLQRLLDDRVDPLEHVRRLIEICVPGERTQRDEYLLWLEVWVRVRSHPSFLDECMRMSRLWYEGVREVFERGVREAVFKPVAPLDEICARYVGIADGLSYRAIVGYRDMPLEEARRVLARFTAEQLGIQLEKVDAQSAPQISP